MLRTVFPCNALQLIVVCLPIKTMVQALLIIEASRGAAAQAITGSPIGCGFVRSRGNQIIIFLFYLLWQRGKA